MLRIELNGDVWEMTQTKTESGWAFTINVNDVPTFGGISPKRFSYKSYREYIDRTYIVNDEVEDEGMKAEVDEILQENRDRKNRSTILKISIVGLLVISLLILIDFFV